MHISVNCIEQIYCDESILQSVCLPRMTNMVAHLSCCKGFMQIDYIIAQQPIRFAHLLYFCHDLFTYISEQDEKQHVTHFQSNQLFSWPVVKLAFVLTWSILFVQPKHMQGTDQLLEMPSVTL